MKLAEVVIIIRVPSSLSESQIETELEKLDAFVDKIDIAAQSFKQPNWEVEVIDD